MPKVKAGVAGKWARRTSNAGEEYKNGVMAPRVPWKAATQAAVAAHTAGVQQAITEKRFEKGVAATAESTWQNAAASKGADRFGPGVAAAEGDYQKGVAPYLAVIESTQLPPRGPKGDPKNYERVKAMGMALNARKRQG